MGKTVINRDVTVTRSRISIPDPTPVITDHRLDNYMVAVASETVTLTDILHSRRNLE